jgi:hypothetical protein
MLISSSRRRLKRTILAADRIEPSTHHVNTRGGISVAKKKSGNVEDETYREVARAERRLLMDEERAISRLEKAKTRLAKSVDRLNRMQDRVAQRQAAVDVASEELQAAQQARADGPPAPIETPAAATDQVESAQHDEPIAETEPASTEE